MRGSIVAKTVWTHVVIFNICKFLYLLIKCLLCFKLVQVCALILESIEIALHWSIVIWISGFAHALCHMNRFTEFNKCFGCKLRPWSLCRISSLLISDCESSAFCRVRDAAIRYAGNHFWLISSAVKFRRILLSNTL